MNFAVIILLPLLGLAGVRLTGKSHKRARGILVRCVCFIEFAACVFQAHNSISYGAASLSLPEVCGMGISFRSDGFRSIYCCIAAFMWFITSLFSEKYFAHYHNRTRYYSFNLLTLTGVMGMFLSDDLYTAFIFFEIMSMASYPWVAHDESKEAMKAAETYLYIAVIGGMVTLMGMFLLYRECSTLSFSGIREAAKNRAVYTASALVLIGFIAKAGAFPLHIWLPKAHPVAPAPASALLSGMLTKAGLFGILVVSSNIFFGSFTYGCVLLGIALTTMLLGAVLGVFSVNLKRTLACSSMSQIGYTLTGVSAFILLGEEGALPAQGALAHMINHSLLKLALFMAAGTVYMNTHKLELNDIRGFGRNKPLLHIIYLFGALGLAGVPGFNGYVSKTMIHEGLVEVYSESGIFAFKLCEWIFLFAAGLTTAYMLKTYIAVFWQKNADSETQARFDGMRHEYLDAKSRIALILSALPIPIIGLFPKKTVEFAVGHSLDFLRLVHYNTIKLFSVTNLTGGAVTLVIGTLVYLFIVRKYMYSKAYGYINIWPGWLDLEEAVYRPFIRLFMRVLGTVSGILGVFWDTFIEYTVLFASSAFKCIDVLWDKFSAFIVNVGALIARILEAALDSITVVIKQFVFVRHHDTKTAAGKTQAFLRKLIPSPRPDPREVTDLTYGSYVTNSVTFGLIICTLGILFAFLIIFLRLR